MSDGINCETVALSPYSVFMGVPVSLWGVAGYLLMAMLSASGAREKKLHATWPIGFLLILALASVGASLALAAISITRIDSLCLFCTGSYVINVALLIVAIVLWKRSGGSLAKVVADDFTALFKRRAACVVALVVGGGALAAARASIPQYWASPGWSDLPKLDSGNDKDGHHWTGATNPTLTIVEYSDYECPHCRTAHKLVRAVVAKHAEKVRLVHRHLPLDQACHPEVTHPFHRRACFFAEASECAARQGKFWEMNDALFASQDTIKASNVDPLELAVRLGINRAEFRRCLGEHEAAGRVAADVRDSIALELSGTPTFIVDGKLLPGKISETQVVELLAKAP
jgi:protein-disulfide isomerase/uncharacterized membrane protein